MTYGISESETVILAEVGDLKVWSTMRKSEHPFSHCLRVAVENISGANKRNRLLLMADTDIDSVLL